MSRTEALIGGLLFWGVSVWLAWGMTTISFRHQLRTQERDFAVALAECVPVAFSPATGVGDAFHPGTIGSIHAPEPYIFADPCGLDSVLCEGEEGWEE